MFSAPQATAKRGTRNIIIAGLLGNIQQESQLNPGIWEVYNTVEEGYGLDQWTKYTDPDTGNETYKFFDWAEGIKPVNFQDHANTPARANDMALNNPKHLMDLQLEYLNMTMQPGHGEWFKGFDAEEALKRRPTDNAALMDGDDIPEVVLMCYRDPLMILHYYNGQVYLYTRSNRSFNTPKKDGTFWWSGGAPYHGVGRLQFDGYKIETIKTAFVDGSSDTEPVYHEVNGKSVTWQEFFAYADEHEEKEEPKRYPFSDENVSKIKEMYEEGRLPQS